VTDFWLGFVSFIGASCLVWSLFQLGRLWERDHPIDDISFTPASNFYDQDSGL
jgi:hypothetical protein